jgi:beta-glucanase (GH16 family)
MVSDEGTTWELVFSDEFETEGRSFYPGDDPYWEAIDLHAWGTNDLEWYDPKQSTTVGGKLVQTLERRPINDLDYAGGSIQARHALRLCRLDPSCSR